MNPGNRFLLKQAFGLAFFIHPNKDDALRVARDALSRLEYTAQAQFKRFYYQPTGRQGRERIHRNKVVLNETQLLQRLVYSLSEELEKEQERQQSPCQKDMLIRFIKFLVKVTLRRNSFYVTLGVSRLLHSYSTFETMELFSILVQDPDRVRDDFYYRSRKKRLIKEICDRFGALLRLNTGNRGEQRFEEAEMTLDNHQLAMECLDRFTPWDSSCVLPEDPAQMASVIPGLNFNGTDPDEEHRVEINRMHTVLHPACYTKLATALNLAAPQARLCLPRFYLGREPGGNEPPRRLPPELDEKDFLMVGGFMENQRKDRRKNPTGVLSLRIDGVHLTWFNPENGPIDFQIDDGVEHLEVYNQEGVFCGGLLLSGMDPMENGETLSASIGLPRGMLNLTFSPAGTRDEWESQIYQVSAQWVASLSRWQLTFDRFRSAISGFRPLILVPSLVLVLICLVFWPTKPQPETDTPRPANQHLEQQTRGVNSRFSGLPLNQIQVVMVLDLGPSAFDQQLQQALTGVLSGHGYQISDASEKADAVIKDISATGSDAGERVLALVNGEGEILWQVHFDPPAQTDETVELARRLLADLLEQHRP